MEEYDKILSELNTDYITNQIIKNNYGKPIDKIYDLIQQAYINHMSYNWFPGDMIILYPSIKELKALKTYDTIYKSFIDIGSSYINYHALLINISKNSKYVLNKPLKFELNDKLPFNILELEELERETNTEISIRKVKTKIYKTIYKE